MAGGAIERALMIGWGARELVGVRRAKPHDNPSGTERATESKGYARCGGRPGPAHWLVPALASLCVELPANSQPVACSGGRSQPLSPRGLLRSPLHPTARRMLLDYQCAGALGVPVVILSGASVVVSGAQRVSQAGKQSSNGRGVPCSAP